MTALTASDLVAAVTPLLPLPRLTSLAVYNPLVLMDHVVLGYSESERDVRHIDVAASFILGAIVEECQRRDWSISFDTHDAAGGTLSVCCVWREIVAHRHRAEHPVLAACAALAASKGAT